MYGEEWVVVGGVTKGKDLEGGKGGGERIMKVVVIRNSDKNK